MIDEYMEKLPVIPATIGTGNQEPAAAFVEASLDRLVVPYVPVTELVIDDAHGFVDAWGKSWLH